MDKIFLLLLYTVTILPQSNSKKDTLTYQLNQVVITATRYTENLMEIPYAVSLISKDAFMINRSLGVDELLKNVPGVLSQSRAGNQDVRLVIRGFGARGAGDRSNYGTTRGIKILQNGIPETEPDGRTSFDLIDVSLAQNVEIIRSNASALWGNASGGVINISTMPDNPYSFNKLDITAGSYGLNKIIASSFIRKENSKFFVSVSNLNFNGWREHSSNYKSLFNLNYIINYDNSKLGVFANATSNVLHVPGPLTEKQFNENPQQANSFYLSRDERRHNRLGRLAVTFDNQLDQYNSISSLIFVSPKYLQRSERGTFRDFNRYFIGGSFIYKNEVNISEKIENHFVTGLDEAYQDGAILFYSLSSYNGRGNQLKDNKREGANNFGLFIQDEVILKSYLSIIAGLGYDNVSYYSENYLNQNLGLQEKSFSKLTPKVGVTYRINPSFSLYGNIGGGIEVPAGNETDPSNTFVDDKIYLINPLLEPIKSTTYEFGTKQIYSFSNNQLLKTLYYEIAFYNINIENDIVPYRSGRFYFTAGKTNRKGIEFTFELKSNYNFELVSALTYSINKYKNYIIDSVHYGKPNIFADYSGNYVAGIPNLFYNVGITYSKKSPRHIYAKLNIQGSSKYFVDDANDLNVPSYLIANLSIGINQVEIFDFIKISSSFSINNILNSKYVSSAYINPDIINKEAYYLEPGMPRNYTFNFSFDL